MILCVCPNPSIDTYAWMPDFTKGDVNRMTRTAEFPGGKATHVALALAELGAEAELMGVWAGGAGQWIQQASKEKGVSCSGPTVSGNNRKCFTFRSDDPQFDNTELLEPGPELSQEDWNRFLETFKARLKEADFICMSGSWPKNAPDDAYRQLLDLAAARNKKVLLDCSGKQLEEAMKTGCFGLHVNQSEAEKFCGSSNLKDLLEKLDGKVDLVALTKGAKGLELYYNQEVVHAKVEIPHVVSTVGSGDCLTAGIAYALTQEEITVKEIAAYGVACGAANCLIEDLGMLQNSDVQELLHKVQFREII